MPQFILKGAPHWYPEPRSLTEANKLEVAKGLAMGYVEAIFFTNGDCGDDDDASLNRLGAGRLTRASRTRIVQDCNDFLSHIIQTEGPYKGAFVRQVLDAEPGGDEQAGHDFWLTRQGHGSGFWDRDDDTWSEPAREALTAACEHFGEVHAVHKWRGWIYYN